MSSSSAGQWIPRPPPISRQEFRSSAVPCSRRGYQANGTAMERPSASSTDNVSALTSTPVANASRISTVEELIPALQQLLSMLLDQRPDLVILDAVWFDTSPKRQRGSSRLLRGNLLPPRWRFGLVWVVPRWRFGLVSSCPALSISSFRLKPWLCSRRTGSSQNLASASSRSTWT